MSPAITITASNSDSCRLSSVCAMALSISRDWGDRQIISAVERYGRSIATAIRLLQKRSRKLALLLSDNKGKQTNVVSGKLAIASATRNPGNQKNFWIPAFAGMTDGGPADLFCEL